MDGNGAPAVPVRPDPLGTHRTPGVAMEWLDAAPQEVSDRATDVAGFVGVAQRGPTHRAVRVDGWDRFRGVFGSQVPYAYLGYAVEAFFANGGRWCWVVRVVDPFGAACASGVVAVGPRALMLTATSPGRWGDRIACRATPTTGGLVTLELHCGAVREVWRGLSAEPGVVTGRDPETVLNDPVTGSRLVAAAWTTEPAPRTGDDVLLRGGADGLVGLRPEHFGDESAGWGLAALDAVDEVSLVCVPDCWTPPKPADRRPRTRRCPPPTCRPATEHRERLPALRPMFSRTAVARLQQDVVEHCERHGDRVALLDAPRYGLDGEPAGVADTTAWRARFRSSYAALYHPWIVVPDRAAGHDLVVPPSGHVAGLCAAGDQAVGAHRAPAGGPLVLAVDTDVRVDEQEHGDLDQAGINAIRVDRGVRVLGNRTLGDPGAPFTRLNVRRLVIALEARVRAAAAWTVFEPATAELCAEVERAVHGVLDAAWRDGLLAGASAEQAYTACCDLTVNPPRELAEGRFTCLIAVLPRSCAEHVVLRLVRSPAGVLVTEPGGGSA